MTIISDQTAIAKELARYFSGSYGSSINTPGSYWNPDALPNNCVVVCIGFILNRTSNQLSHRSNKRQPPDGFKDWEQIEAFLEHLKEMRLVREYLMTETPFKYERYIGPGDDLVLYRRPVPGRVVKHCVLGSHHEGNYSFHDFQHHEGGTKIPMAKDAKKEFESAPGVWDFSRIDYTVKVVPWLN
ncbi:hypothetical protein N7537_006939 [Penicillium hordei]|uniref:Uncharacterized protein n=1 Tax=Penicillium hordei TaxID=40994 RepID=A0AAD6H3K2_9EURO|nr:uncharacterized protein N7537_006939 [Penicillium hordei]KAJ5603983.1 hypothetical protein N7537_006939 [Penicillium hordei]